ncbi:hypothetical protein AB6A40_003708 [Gnathostoma spinigerum]|uniref:Uncharacterized protein n=1 Tax=Gnathostoma spinigerum TaxID=75299 RepID=A0ABD6EI34_9BILA
MTNRGFESPSAALGVLRVAGLVAFIGQIFVTLTQSCQMILQREHVCNGLDARYFGLAVCDIFVKMILMQLDAFPDLYLGTLSRTLLHFMAASVTLIIAACTILEVDVNLIINLDPILAVITAVILCITVYPALNGSLPVLFGQVPKHFDIDSFKEQIHTEFPSVTCDHAHIYRSTSDNFFDAFLTVTYYPNTAEPNWEEGVQKKISVVIMEIGRILRKKGAKNVTIQPNFVETGQSSSTYLCAENCEMPMSCCTNSEGT